MTRNTNFKGSPLTLTGKEIKVGEKLPTFKLTGVDMNDITTETFAGKTLVIVTIPSLDTPVCSIETKRFDEETAKLSSDVSILVVSRDLPFAQKRWCGAEGVENLTTASDYKYRTFAESLGVLIQDWQILSRAVFVVGKDGIVKHAQYVPEISEEPDYDAVLKAI